jgi:sugar lactone lactonase YvrE
VSLSVRFRQGLCGLLGALTLGVSQNAYASFSLTFQGLVQTLNTGGSISLSSPAGIFVDSSGNTFVVDTGNNRVVEVNAQGTASVLAISGLSPSLSSPSGIASDGAGNLYIADTGNSRIVELSPAGVGSVISTGSVTLSSPRAVALDQSGDLFIADTGNNRVVEVPSGGSSAVLTITVSSGTSTLSSPKGLWVNTGGKLYIADSGNNRIVTVVSGSTTGVVQSVLGGVTLSNPSAVVTDDIGNVYIADTGNDRIAEIDTSNNGTVLYTGSVTLNGPLGLSVDPFGTVFVSDTGDSRGVVVDPLVNADLAPGDETYSLNQSVVGFGHVTLGSENAVTFTLPFTTGSVGLGGVQVFTLGTGNLDFTAGPDTSCNSSTTASTSCSVQISFLPTAPGLRRGSVVLYDTSQNPILTIPLYGFGDSPLAALNPSTATVLSTGAQVTSNPYQLALDGAGNMYVGDYTGKNVVKIPAGGGSATLVSLGTPGDPAEALQNITGVAVDGAGNLFIGDHQNNRILVMTPGGVVSVLSITGLSPTLGFPTALAFDGAQNLYIGDFTNGRIVKVSSLVVAGSTSSGLGTVIGTGSYTFTGSTVTGLSVDSGGSIYIAARTQNNSSIIKVTRAGIASAVVIPSNITPAISNPQGVTVDANGNIYIVDSANTRIVEITTAGVASVVGITGLTNPSTLSTLVFGTTVDAYGNLYILDWTNNRIVFLNISGAALSFPNTNVGATSAAQTATVTNLGNQSLVFSANPSYTANFSNNSGDTNPCTSSTSLLSGIACDVSVTFTPQSAGSLSTGITLTNNTLNVASSTQQVSVSGTGISTADTTATAVTVNPNSLTAGQTTTISAMVSDTASGHTSNVPTGQVSFTDTIGSTTTTLAGSPVSLSGGIATMAGVQLSGAGTHTISANYAGVSGSYAASSGIATVTVAKASVTIGGPSAQPIIAVGQGGSIVITVTGSSAIAAPSGSVSYSILNASGASVATGSPALTAGSGSSTASIAIPSTLPSGAYTISIIYSGDSNYSANATAVSVPFSVGQVTPTISWTPAASSIPYGASLSGILNATAVNGTTTIPGTFTYTATLAGGSATPVTSATVLGAGSYTLTVTFTPTNTTVYFGASQTVTLTVSQASATIGLISSLNPALVTSAVTFTASVSSGLGTVAGTVNFYDGTALLGTVTLAQNTAAFTTSSLVVGTHAVTAVLGGNASFTSSTSNVVSQVIQDFSLSGTSSTGGSGSGSTPTQTVAPGGTATYTLALGPISGVVFPVPVTLSVSGAPSGATATVSPQVVAAGSPLTNVILTVQLPATTASLHPGKPFGAHVPAVAWGVVLLPFLGRLRRAGKRMNRTISVLFLCAAAMAATAGLGGCGSSSSGFFAHPQQNYSIVVTATAGTLSRSTTVTLIVQ